MESTNKPQAPPLDLSHLYSATTKARLASNIKKYYRFFQIPGIGNLAGGASHPPCATSACLTVVCRPIESWKRHGVLLIQRHGCHATAPIPSVSR